MKARLLLIDNDVEMVRLLRQHLEAEDYVVTAVTSGREGLDAMERETFDVVITDVVMDDVSGLDVLGAASRRQAATRVILMTAFGTLDSAIAAIRKGAFDYLTKPFKLDEVSVAVDRIAEEIAREALAAIEAAYRRDEGDEFVRPTVVEGVDGRVRDGLRRRGRRPTVSLDDMLPKFSRDGHHLRPIVDWTGGAPARLSRDETRSQVRACIDRLPDDYRTILLLRDIEGLDTIETARLLGITPNAVKLRLHRARQALRTLLECPREYFYGRFVGEKAEHVAARQLVATQLVGWVEVADRQDPGHGPRSSRLSGSTSHSHSPSPFRRAAPPAPSRPAWRPACPRPAARDS